MPWKGIVGEGFTADDFDMYVATVAFDTWRPQFVVLHNTAVPSFAQWHNVAGEDRMRALEHYYRDVQKWSAGPHLFIADDLIWVFTPLNVPGVHSPSWNSRSWGVELVGNYSAESLLPQLQLNAASALASLHAALGLDPQTLHFHKEDPLTTHKDCPGRNVVKPTMIQWVLDEIAARHPGEHPAGDLALGQGAGQ